MNFYCHRTVQRDDTLAAAGIDGDLYDQGDISTSTSWHASNLTAAKLNFTTEARSSRRPQGSLCVLRASVVTYPASVCWFLSWGRIGHDRTTRTEARDRRRETLRH